MQNPERLRKKKSILVRVPNWVGDAVLSLGFIHALKRQLGTQNLIILAHERVAPLFFEEGEVVSFGGREIFPLSLSLRGDIETGIVLPLSFSSALSLFLTGARKRIGFKKEGRGIFLTHGVSLPKGFKREEHLLSTFFRLLSPFGYEGPRVNPELILTDEEIEEGKEILEKEGLVPERVVAIAPFTFFGSSKEWGEERFLSLAKGLLDRGYTPLILGAVQERERGLRFSRVPGIHSMIGKYPLRLIAAILNHIKMLVSNDSGLAHIAASVGLKVVVIFGSTNPRWTAPIGDKVSVIYNPPPCSPCFKTYCKLPRHLCMENISVGEVMRASLQSLTYHLRSGEHQEG